jgi:alkanesulfonate monooxygenase SsuD/methylene tetrahydromethanopterin reductase-like flavin-dependent oxidoreductase (luciferase family)
VIALLEAAARAADPGDEPIVGVADPGEHPVALAEAAVVAHLLLRGRLVLVIEPGEPAEAFARALRAVTPSVPVRYELRAD